MKLSKESKLALLTALIGDEPEGQTTQTGGSFYKVGKDYVVRTVTMIYLGEIKSESDNYLVLSNCAWIPDTSRWSEFLDGKKPNEMEPYQNDVIVYKTAILDATEMTKTIKREII